MLPNPWVLDDEGTHGCLWNSHFQKLTMRKNSINALQKLFTVPLTAATLVLVLLAVIPANSCPFCSAVARTFAEQIETSDVVVIASLETKPEGADVAQLPRAKFKITNVLKGEKIMGVGKVFETVVVSNKHKIGEKFLVMGNGTDTINWTTPQLVSEEVINYLKQLDSLPKKGAERLAFFVNYFENDESMLAYDAYDEFARAPYEDVRGLKDSLDKDQLIAWIKDPEVMKSRKRLYYTLLGVSGGGPKEIAFLEEVMKSGDRDRQAGLDALIACYLTLKGDAGVPLVEETFLKNPDAEYIDVFSTISALRFHGTEAEVLSRPRIVEALRYVLDRPKMADMVIPDLARWEDWSVMNRLVQMFKECDSDETRWVRTPIISYLQACPKSEAKTYIEELREIDPDAAKRAEMLAELDWGDDDDDDWDDDSEAEESADDTPAQPKPIPESSTPPKQESKGSGGSDQGQLSAGESEIRTSRPGEAVSLVLKPPVDRYISTELPSSAASEPQDAADRDQDLGNSQLARRSVANAPPVAVIVPATPSAIMMLLSALGICGILFLLLWSVLNGTFHRLIS